MDLNRREFVILTVATLAAGCEGEATSSGNPAPKPIVDAGPVDAFTEDRVYDNFRENGFFVIRREKKLFALSSICTHKSCKVRATVDQSFYCKCHHSTFDREGKVTKGPAKRDLPRLTVATNQQNHLLVKVAG